MARQVQDAFIVAARRTPVGKAPRGVFRHTRPDDLLTHVIRGVLQDAPSVDRERIGDVIVGCAMPEAEQGLNVARVAALLSGLPDAVPGMTINRFCSSGLQAIALAADRIRLGEADLMIAGGTESMSLIPSLGNKPAFNNAIFTDENVGIAYGMGITAEQVARRWQISREDQDAFAYRSHQLALKARETGEFTEILPYTVRRHFADSTSGAPRLVETLVSEDEGPRPDTSPEKLARLRPVFDAKGSVTAGNSSQTSDGAGAVMLASGQAVKDHGLKPLARFVGYAVAGVPPEIMGIGPREAIPRVLSQTGLNLADMDWIELNEAFAAQSLAVIRDVGLDPDKVNPNGGAISSGHPLGATGAIRTAMAVHALRRHQLRYAMVTMCIGTGMGAAGIFEAV